MTDPEQEIGIAWHIGTEFGWGLFGYQIALHLEKQKAGQNGMPTALLLQRPTDLDQHPLEILLFDSVLKRERDFRKMLDRHAGEKIVKLKFPVLHALGNKATNAFFSEPPHIAGSRNIGLTFLEDTHLPPPATEVFNRFEHTIAGSSWVQDILESHNVENAATCLQGVDPSLFHPAPKAGLFKNRFVVFSGGKLEFRKGQDIVLAAFDIFQKRHPDALLLSVWGNQWPHSISYKQFANSPHMSGGPDLLKGDQIDWRGWLSQTDIPANNISIFRSVTHRNLPNLIREADVALFPNRAEGGTNLVAMECMACGIPTILSANTGHLDIIDQNNCYPLTRQKPVSLSGLGFGAEGWGESDIEEIVETLEAVYQNRHTAIERAKQGSRFMSELAWDTQISKLMHMTDLI